MYWTSCIYMRTLMGNFDTQPESWCTIFGECDCENCPILNPKEDEDEDECEEDE